MNIIELTDLIPGQKVKMKDFYDGKKGIIIKQITNKIYEMRVDGRTVATGSEYFNILLICPDCEKGELKEIIKDLCFNYRSQSKIFENEKVAVCDLCGKERLLSHEDNERVDKELADFRRRIEN